jgi:MFS family permease
LSLVGAAGVCARILWGHWTQTIAHIGTPLAAVAVGGAVSISLVVLTVRLDHNWLLWCAVVLFGLTGVAANVVVMVAVVGLAPIHQLGRASGVLATGLFIGFACGPASFGVIADASNGYSLAWGAVIVLYAFAAILAFHVGRDHRQRRRVTPSPPH